MADHAVHLWRDGARAGGALPMEHASLITVRRSVVSYAPNLRAGAGAFTPSPHPRSRSGGVVVFVRATRVWLPAHAVPPFYLKVLGRVRAVDDRAVRVGTPRRLCAELRAEELCELGDVAMERLRDLRCHK